MIQSYDNQGENFREYRGYRLDRVYPQAMWKITKGGNGVRDLPGMYTSLRLAVSGIDAYIDNLQKLETLKKSAKTKSQ